MSLSNKALGVVTRSLPKDKIKQRPGKGGMTFNYISADLVIDLLNEAFEHTWSTCIVSREVIDDTAVVGLELTVPSSNTDVPIRKQQFGSCDIGRGMGPGEAFKGAASDALKKAATLLGIGLELYQDDDTSSTPTRLPQQSKPKSAPPAPKSAPKADNPFSNGSPAIVASVPAPKRSAPPAPKAASASAVPAPRANPFVSESTREDGPNSIQMSALLNLSSRKDLSQSDMIALVGVDDAQGNPVQSFEELTRTQAIEVIKAAQL